MTKKCKECLVEKPLHDFPPNKAMSDGHRNDCRQCRNKRDSINNNFKKPYITRHPESEKFCSCCSTEKKAKDFYKDRKRNDGLSVKCKECFNKVLKNREFINGRKNLRYNQQN